MWYNEKQIAFMRILNLLIFSFIFSFSSILAQPPAKKSNNSEPKPISTEEAFEKEYQKRIKKERLYGVYIPKDMADAFVQLNLLIDKESQAKFKTMSEDDAIKKLHFSFGRWIVHNWGFYGGSRYSHYLKQIGIHHPEEMARFTIIMYHRNLNKQKLNVKEYLEAFKAKKETEKAKKMEKAKVLKTYKRKREN